MNAQAPHLDLTLLLPPDLAWAVDAADRAARDRIDTFAGEPDSQIFQNDVRALATLTRIRKTVADFLLRHPELIPDQPDNRGPDTPSPATPPDSPPPPADSPDATGDPAHPSHRSHKSYLSYAPEPSASPPSPPQGPSHPEPPPNPSDEAAPCQTIGSTASTRSTPSPPEPPRTESDSVGPRECFSGESVQCTVSRPLPPILNADFQNRKRTFDLHSPPSSHPVNPVNHVDSHALWKPAPPPRRDKPRPHWEKPTVPYRPRPRPGDPPEPDPTMARIMAGELDVLPDGSVVPYLDPAARAPMANVHQLLSPRLERDLAKATRDLADAMPYHLTSASLKKPHLFARDVHRLGQIVSLHTTLAEATMAQRDLTKNLEGSPLARTDAWTALALSLPNPPADKLDDLFAWLDSPEEPQTLGAPSACRRSAKASGDGGPASSSELSNFKSEIPSPNPSSYPSYGSHPSYSSVSVSHPSHRSQQSQDSPLLNSLAVVENLSDASSPETSPSLGTPSSSSASVPSSHLVHHVNPVDFSSPPFNASLCLARIDETRAALASLDPRHPIRSGLRLMYSRLCPSDPSTRSTGSTSSASSPSQFSIQNSQFRSAQPSLAVLPGLSLNPSWLPHSLARVTLNRILPKKTMSPTLLGKHLKVAMTENAIELIDPMARALARARRAFRRAHAPP